MDSSENISFVDKSFDLNKITQYHLSLQVFLEGFSFAVLDRERNKFIALHHENFPKITSYKVLANAIEGSLATNPIFDQPFNHIKCAFVTPKYTYTPSAFYEPANALKFFAFNHQVVPTDEFETNYLYGNSTYITFAMPKLIKKVLEAKLGTVKYFHQTAPLIEEVLLSSKITNAKKTIFVSLYHQFFDIAYVDEGVLKLVNTFSYSTTTDFLYFVLNAYDQLKLQPTTTPLCISGIIEKNSELVQQLKRFISQIEYLEKPEHFEYCYGFNEVPDHYFTNLINLYQCG